MHPKIRAMRQEAASKRIVEAVNKLAEQHGLEVRAITDEALAPEVALLLRVELAADVLEAMASTQASKQEEKPTAKKK